MQFSRLHPVVIFTILLTGADVLWSTQADMPPQWRTVCHRVSSVPEPKFTLLSLLQPLTDIFDPRARNRNKDDTPETVNVTLACVIPNDARVYWKLNDFRDWVIGNRINENTTPENRSVTYDVHVVCALGANISLPWPMRVPGLRELYVGYCLLTDRYASYMDPVEASLPDELRILDIRHSAWVIGSGSRDIAITSEQALNLTSAYECGQDTSLEVMIFRNVSDITDFQPGSLNMTVPPGAGGKQLDIPQGFIDGEILPEDRLIKDSKKVVSASQDDKQQTPLMPPPNLDLTNLEENLSKEAQIDFLDLLKKSINTRTSCQYNRLRLMDESMASFTPLFHFEFLVQGANYPVLEIMNYSRIGMNELPRELTEWRRYFPNLKLLDLTHNHISSVSVKKFPTLSPTGQVTFDLRYNNITTITYETLAEWRRVDDFFVDIRNNPIDCGCDIKHFIPYLKNPFDRYLEQYEYVRSMTCATPSDLAGKMLKDLDEDSLQCMELASSNRLALIILGGTVFLLLLLLLVIIRYKVEIRILLYTRLHVRLPCDADASMHLKQYDAFVSYSNDDAPWVYENLVKFLEGSDVVSPSSSSPSTPVSPYTSTPSFANSDYSSYTNSSDISTDLSSVYKHINNNISTNSSSSSNSFHLEDMKAGKSSSSLSSASSSSNNRSDKRPFRLCLHQKDFVPGKTIVDNIVDCIEASRHTIIVLSPRFMKSHWAMEELRQAYRQSLVEKTRHLIVILLETIPKEDMDPLIARCCKTFTYLNANDSLFRDRLIFSLTTKDRETRRRDRLAAKEQKRLEKEEQSSGEDNLAFSVHLPRPPEPVRGLSNISTTSTSVLAEYL
ncbi:toll-like protein [Plakobranchus ocellatus]|uniref:Toll-like protein n=1 Tax=Plakobranchus ocellatus TaxID=259542 RepID=A0AAV4C1W8_9GAST|nr:toll-like protein [Plakobranchus ocellatus]